MNISRKQWRTDKGGVLNNFYSPDILEEHVMARPVWGSVVYRFVLSTRNQRNASSSRTQCICP